MVRRHQPDVVIDNRLETSGEGFGSLVTEHPAYYSGDFVSPEPVSYTHLDVYKRQLQFNVEFRILQFLCYCHFEIPTVREPRLSEPRKIGGHFLRGCVSLHQMCIRDRASTYTACQAR